MKPETLHTPRLDAGLEGSFEVDLRAAMLRVRGALTELLDSIGADSSQPQDISRRFGLNRNLTWKLSRIVRSPDPVTAISHLPGAPGLKILLETCGRSGAPLVVRERVIAAFDAFDEVVRRHARDRTGLDMLLRSMAQGEGAAEAQEPSRRQVFQGNAAIWGVQARARFALHVHVPSADVPGRVDFTVAGGLLGFMRLRPSSRWPLMRTQRMRQEPGAPDELPAVEPLDPTVGLDGTPLAHDFSTMDPSRIESLRVPNGRLWQVSSGPVGLTGSSDVVFARRSPGMAAQHATDPGDRNWGMLVLYTPVEVAQLDLLVHRDLSYADVVPETHLLGRMVGSDFSWQDEERFELPVAGQLEDLGSGPPQLASPLWSRHAELAAWTLDRLGQRAEDFRAWRLVLSYPPLPSSLAMSVELPEAPAGA